MDVPVLMSTAGGLWVCRVRNVNHKKATLATGVAPCAHSIDHISLFMSDNVMRAAKAVKPSGEVLLDGKFSWFANSQQL